DALPNQEFAEAALAIVRKDFKATGLKAANKRHNPGNFPTEVTDTQRLSQADLIVTRMYSNEASLRAGQYALVLKLGAGNCDLTAGVSAQMINKSGGNAATWYVAGAHTFTVVGDVPLIGGKQIDSTIGFSEPGWEQVW